MAENESEDPVEESAPQNGGTDGGEEQGEAPNEGPPATIRTAAPVVGRKGVLAFSLAWAGLTFVFPILLLVWLLALLIGVIAIGEALQHTDGLVATTFGAGYIIGAITVFALSLLLIVLKVAWREEPDRFWRRIVTHPFLIPGGLALVASMLSALFEGEGTDLPDTLTTAAFLGAWDWVLFLLPLWFLVAGLKWAWKAFKWAGQGPYRSGLLSGLAMGLGLLGTVELATLPLEEADEELPRELEAVFDAIDRAPAGRGVIEDTHAVFAAVSSVVGEPSTGARLQPSAPSGGFAPDSPGYKDAFGRCAEDLAKNPPGASELDRAIGRLVRKGTAPAVAEDVAHLTLILVCEKHAAGQVRSYVPYFVRAVQNNDRYRHRDARLVYCEIPVGWDRGTWDAPAGGSELRDTERAFCRLSESDRQVLLLSAEGLGADELAAALGTTSAAARQRLSRARSRFREHL